MEKVFTIAIFSIITLFSFNRINNADSSFRIESANEKYNTIFADVTQYGIKNNGTNVTDALNALPSGNYYFPAGTYGIDGKTYQGFKPKSDSIYYFEEGAVLKVLTNNYSHYAGILIRNCDNLRLINPTIEGDRKTHFFVQGQTHEWGHGIIITDNCGDIVIDNPTIYDVIGDGIDFICPSSNVTVNNVKVYRARRQGISIEDVGNLTINGGLLEDISGTSPGAGVAIEPFELGHHLDNVTINNVITRNTNQGLLFANLHMAEGYNITINDCTFDGIFVCNSKKVSSGKVDINNAYINGDNVGVFWTNAYVKMTMNNPVFRVDHLNNEGTREGIFRFCEQDKVNGDIIGGLVCTNAQILNAQSENNNTRIFNFSNSHKTHVSDIEIYVVKSNMTNSIWATTPSTLSKIKLSDPKNVNITKNY